jgi:hypothetical protein
MAQFIRTITETGNRDTNVRTIQYETGHKESDHVTGTKRYYDGKIKTMRLAGHVECKGEVRNALDVSV